MTTERKAATQDEKDAIIKALADALQKIEEGTRVGKSQRNDWVNNLADAALRSVGK